MKKAISMIVVVIVVLGLLRWQQAGTYGGPVKALEHLIDSGANLVAHGLPDLIGMLSRLMG